MKTTTSTFLGALLLATAVGCGGGSTTPAKNPDGSLIKKGDGAAVSAEAANKFKAGLEAMAQHDKANDWNDANCNSTAQLFIDAAKEQGDKFAEATYNAGLAYQRCKKTAEAKNFFSQTLSKDPKFHRARMQLALYKFAESNERDIDSAIAEMRQAAVVDAQFKNVEALVHLGMLYMKRNNNQADNDGANDLARAKKYAQSALAVDDGYMPAFNLLALIYLEAAKQKAGRTSRRAAAGGSREKKVDTQALELAALVCSQAIRKNPSYASIHNTAGMINVELGNLNSAVQSFNTARKLDPSFFEAQMNFAAVNMQFRGFEQAEEAYRAALKMRPNDYDAHLGLALALRGQINDANFDKMVPTGKPGPVELELAEAKKIAPERPEAYFNEAIFTQEYKAKGGGDAALKQAITLFQEFARKAGSSSEYAEAVKSVTQRPTKSDRECSTAASRKDPACQTGRIYEIEQIIEFNKQDKAARAAAEAEAKQRAAEAEVSAGEDEGAKGD